jgi:hypothetical protein
LENLPRSSSTHIQRARCLAALAVVVVRLQLDPLLELYYLTGPEGLILVGASLGAAGFARVPGVRREFA